MAAVVQKLHSFCLPKADRAVLPGLFVLMRHSLNYSICVQSTNGFLHKVRLKNNKNIYFHGSVTLTSKSCSLHYGMLFNNGNEKYVEKPV